MVNENAEQFWNRVKELIKQNKITQEALAKDCDVSLNVLKSWIFNKRLPDAAQAIYIAKSLNTSVEYLVNGEESSAVDSKVISTFNNIPDNNKDLAYRVLEQFVSNIPPADEDN